MPEEMDAACIAVTRTVTRHVRMRESLSDVGTPLGGGCSGAGRGAQPAGRLRRRRGSAVDGSAPHQQRVRRQRVRGHDAGQRAGQLKKGSVAADHVGVKKSVK